MGMGKGGFIAQPLTDDGFLWLRRYMVAWLVVQISRVVDRQVISIDAINLVGAFQ